MARCTICGSPTPAPSDLLCSCCARGVFTTYQFPIEDFDAATLPQLLEEVELVAWWALGIGYSVTDLAEGEVVLPAKTTSAVRALIEDAPESWAVLAADLADGTLPAPWLARR